MTSAADRPNNAEEPDTERRRVLVAGDADGNLVKLFSQVENQQNKVGTFNVLFAVGAFLPAAGGPDAAQRAASLSEYVTGKRKAPVETYFIESRSAAMLQASPEGRQVCEGVHFLGGFGIRTIAGLRVAYLSGRHDPKTYDEDSEAGPAFKGTAYTKQAIEGLIRLAQESESSPIDLLLTSEWAKGIEQKMDDADAPKDLDNNAMQWDEISSPAVSELILALEPRYHICGTGDRFYLRPPFQTQRSGHVCRCIALGKVGSKAKGRLWIHGLALAPAKSMPPAVLMQRPPNTTPCPLVKKEANCGAKRAASNFEEDSVGEMGRVVPDQIFLQNLPPNIQEKDLERQFSRSGKIERTYLAREDTAGRPCKGHGWISFSCPEEAQAALAVELECGGQMIKICLAKPNPAGSGPPKKKREIQISIEPHSDCWFCLVNPKAEKHMIVCASSDVYLAVARGPILSSHVMILPVKHAPCYTACPPELQAKIQAQVGAIRKMFAAAGQDVLLWERWIPMSISVANHMQIQIVPVDQVSAQNAREVLQETFSRHLPKGGLKRVASHAEVSQHVNDDPETPYVYFEIPGDNSAKGRLVERYVYAGIDQNSARIPIDFGRRVACNLVGSLDKVDWRNCVEDRESEKAIAQTFRQQFLPFQPSKKK